MVFRLQVVVSFFLLTLFTLAMFAPHFVHAQFDESGMIIYNARFIPLENFEGSAKLSDVYASGELSVFLNRLFLAAMSLGAVLAVLRLAWAGFQYMASDLWSSKEHAKEIIRETLLGLFLLLGIWLILGQINPDILKLNVNITKLPANAPAAPATSAPGTSPFDEAGLNYTPDTNTQQINTPTYSPTPEEASQNAI
jgi:hypothetical protein